MPDHYLYNFVHQIFCYKLVAIDGFVPVKEIFCPVCNSQAQANMHALNMSKLLVQTVYNNGFNRSQEITIFIEL